MEFSLFIKKKCGDILTLYEIKKEFLVMPDIITHYIFGLDTAHNLKNSAIYPILKENRDLFFIGLQGPDPIYYHRLRNKDSKTYIASKMHTEKTGDFLISALCHIKKYAPSSKEYDACLSYICGFICHYILDSMAHPYVFYLGGRYLEDVPETHKYMGLHRKIELAIDSILCEERLSIKSSNFKVHKTILKHIEIPGCILAMYDEVLFLGYGINNGGTIFKESYNDIRTYYKFTHDRFGTKKAFSGFVSPLLPKSISPYVGAFSYFDCINSSFDYMNRSKRVWLHPVTGNVYTFSFYDILRNATKKSTALLQAAYEFTNSQISAEDIRGLLPNISYLTGLSSEDTRPMKYVSSDYTNV